MRHSQSFACAALVVVVVMTGDLVAQDLKSKRHTWSQINYASLPCPWASGTARPSLRAPGKDETQGLLFGLTFFRSYVDESQKKFVEPDPQKLTVRMHFADGKVVSPKNPGFEVLGWFGNSLGASASVQRVFPWTENKLLEAWIEVRYPGHVFWLEVPYGFTRNPSDALCAPSKSGRPKLAPAMKKLEEGAKIVKWKHVEYDLGKIQNGWGLTLMHSNPFDAHSEIVLFRDDFRIGKSAILWDLYSPRTSVIIRHANGNTQKGWAKSLRLHDDGLRRSDKFNFNRNGRDDEMRDWGTIVIDVDGKSREAVVPSSLFRYVHGVADPYHKATLR